MFGAEGGRNTVEQMALLVRNTEIGGTVNPFACRGVHLAAGGRGFQKREKAVILFASGSQHRRIWR